MRTLVLGAALLFAAPALACPMADASALQEAAAKVEASSGTKVTLLVSGMHCGGCAQKVMTKLGGIEGVEAAVSDHTTGRTVVAFDATKVKTEALVEAVKSLGYKVTVENS